MTRAHRVAVAWRDASRAERFAAEFGYAKAYGGIEALLADEKVDIVHIAVPHVYHRAIAEQALRAGKAYPVHLTRLMFGEFAEFSHSRFLTQTGVEDSAGILARHANGASSIIISLENDIHPLLSANRWMQAPDTRSQMYPH